MRELLVRVSTLLDNALPNIAAARHLPAATRVVAARPRTEPQKREGAQHDTRDSYESMSWRGAPGVAPAGRGG